MELFFDTETSGFYKKNLRADDPDQAWVVQLAAVLSDENKIYQSINLLIRSDGRSIHPKAEEVHGISTNVAAEFGIPESKALEIFASLLANRPTKVCHNYAFDSVQLEGMLARQSKHVNGATVELMLEHLPVVCTMLKSTNFCQLPGRFGKYKWPKLEELYYILFEEKFPNAHDALADVLATRKCYYKLKELNVL